MQLQTVHIIKDNSIVNTKKNKAKSFFFFQFILLLFITENNFGQASAFTLAAGGGSLFFDEALSAVSDNNGNIYTGGYFSGIVDFDPSSSGVYNLTASGPTDIFIQKLNAAGALVWAYKFGGLSVDRCHAVALDNAGNIFITGFFNDTANFSMGTGTATLSSSGAQDIFIVKLDTAGNLLFANKIGGAGNESANAIATDADGDIIITGSFSGSVNFNTSGGSTVLSSTGYSDIFIAKYNAAGSLLWAKAEGSAYTDAANAICTSISGNIYVTGYFSDTVDFDTGPGQQFLSSNGGIDMFVQKFDANGNFNWVKNMGGIGTEEGLGIAADNLENVYTTGRFDSVVDFDPGNNIYTLVSNGKSDVFIQKLNTDGNLIFAKSIGSIYSDAATAITVSNNKDVFLTGYFSGNADFNPDTNVYNINSAGLRDLFMEKMDTAGNFLWAANTGAAGNDKANSITININSKIITSGYFSNTVDFDYTSNQLNLSSNGSVDFFVQQSDNCLAAGFSTVSSNMPAICAGDTAKLFITDGKLNSATHWQWYSGSCGQLPAGTGDTILVAPDTTTSYYVRGEGGCLSNTPCGVISLPVNNCLTVSLSNAAILCNGGTATIAATAANGIQPFTYSLNGGSFNSSNTFIVPAGTYTVIAKDAANDTASSNTVIVTQPSPVIINFTKMNVSCFGGSDGSLTINATGGTPPYQYSFDDGATYQSDSAKGNLSAGFGAIIWVSDANNCKMPGPGGIIITQPRQLGILGTCYLPVNKVLGVQAKGGTSPYSFSLNGTNYAAGNQRNGNAKTWSSILAGTYTIYIKDSKNCSFTKSVKTDTLPACPSSSPLAFAKQSGDNSQAMSRNFMASVYPNPSAGRFIITVSGNTGEPVSIRVLDVAGRIIYTAFGNNNTFYFGEKFVPGVYIAEAGSGNNSTRIKIIKQ